MVNVSRGLVLDLDAATLTMEKISEFCSSDVLNLNERDMQQLLGVSLVELEASFEGLAEGAEFKISEVSLLRALIVMYIVGEVGILTPQGVKISEMVNKPHSSTFFGGKSIRDRILVEGATLDDLYKLSVYVKASGFDLFTSSD